MQSLFQRKDIISISDFDTSEILHLLDVSQELKENAQPDLLRGKILASCFFEPSTRTRLSFESAMHRLGGNVIGFSDSTNTSVQKGESLHDTIKIVESYADAIVIRHSLEGSARYAAEIAEIPVINAGDGANQHPTQTFLDLFSIRECQGTLNNLQIAFMGDLKYGRTVHSLAEALTHFGARLYFISPSALEMPKEICDLLRANRIKFSFHQKVEEIISRLDILYMTRIQEERFSHSMEYERVTHQYILKPQHLERAKPNLKILHPMPRVNEMDQAIDKLSYAYYFTQASNGLFVRQALLSLVLQGEV